MRIATFWRRARAPRWLAALAVLAVMAWPAQAPAWGSAGSPAGPYTSSAVGTYTGLRSAFTTA